MIWTAWKGRDNLIFKSEVFNIVNIIDEIKSRLWNLFSVYCTGLHSHNFHEWLLEPRKLLDC